MNVIPEALRSGSPLAEHYLRYDEAIHHLYEYDFRDAGSYAARAEWLDRTEDTRVDRQDIVRFLRSYNRRLNSHPAVMESIERLAQPNALVISGGQQSGLFTGSLLVIYKAATIIKAAEEAEKKLNRPVIPVFWIAGEDHDWDEVDHTYMMTADLNITKVRMPGRYDGRASVSEVSVDRENWLEAIHKLEELLPDTEFKPGLISDIKAAVQDDNLSLSDVFAKLMGQLFGSYGLVLLDSADPELRALEVPIFERMIEDNDSLERCYHESAGHVVTSGFGMQAEVTADCANLFYIHEGSRLLLHKENGKFIDRRGYVSFTKTELIDILRQHPERFSNNVLTRPLMQDSLFPVLSTVLGHAEIAYWALTKEAFHRFGLRMPILQPRMSFTILDQHIQKLMDKYDLSFHDIQYAFNDKKDTWLGTLDEFNMNEQFELLKTSFHKLYAPVLEQLNQIEPGLGRLGVTNSSKIEEQISYMQLRTKQAIAQRHDASVKQWDTLDLTLFPMKRPQERVYNVYGYLNRYGTRWLTDLMNIPADLSGHHHILYI
ncbi:bacillithiol biosynthesis cysteine-adding enzyme BshC [Paenibacillus sp. GYB006]|uniref:bacillithiol biosynthesis cysteine-adding enzyme BshC n=1 Tax=Paenibacillus sp. GYB006 TaxID=2994394 RepID=UPI002F96CA5C